MVWFLHVSTGFCMDLLRMLCGCNGLRWFSLRFLEGFVVLKFLGKLGLFD